MRLALSRAMLKEPELLLLDEPTNHVDVHGVAWLTKYVQDLSAKSISSMIVSHDSVFLDNVAQDMVHYEKNRKLKVYPGNLTEFVKLVQLCVLENTFFYFLKGVKETGAAPPRDRLVQRCLRDMAFFSFVADTAANRRKGWRRIVLLFNFFIPGATQVCPPLAPQP